MEHRIEQNKGQFLIYKAENGTLKLDVRLENDTVWLTQPLMAELFQTSIPNVSMHIRNIYNEGELFPEATVKKFLTVRLEGKREVKRLLDYYNLDMIISVGYRVKSAVATRFRIWATQQLAENEYDKFSTKRIEKSTNSESDFDKAVKMIEPLNNNK